MNHVKSDRRSVKIASITRMVEVSTSASRVRASFSVVVTAIVTLLTMSVLSGVAPRLCTAVARDAAVRSTRPGHRQALESAAHTLDLYEHAGSAAIRNVDERDAQPDHTKQLTHPPAAVLNAGTLLNSFDDAPASRAQMVRIDSSLAPRADGRAPPVA